MSSVTLLLQCAHSSDQVCSVFVTDVTSYFTGSDTVVVRCHKCSTESKTKQKFYDIPLHFPDDAAGTQQQPISLVDMLANAFQPEPLTGDNQFYCAHCGRVC